MLSPVMDALTLRLRSAASLSSTISVAFLTMACVSVTATPARSLDGVTVGPWLLLLPSALATEDEESSLAQGVLVGYLESAVYLVDS